jgi:hypothetical protein
MFVCLKSGENRRILNKASGSESLRLGENIEFRSDPFIILRFGVHYSIFNLRSFRYGESNSFNKAISAPKLSALISSS